MHKRFDSSVIDSASFVEGRLEVTLKNGRRYRYYNVPESEAQRFMEAPSAGGHFNSVIRRDYSGERVEEDD